MTAQTLGELRAERSKGRPPWQVWADHLGAAEVGAMRAMASELSGLEDELHDLARRISEAVDPYLRAQHATLPDDKGWEYLRDETGFSVIVETVARATTSMLYAVGEGQEAVYGPASVPWIEGGEPEHRMAS